MAGWFSMYCNLLVIVEMLTAPYYMYDYEY